MNVLVTGMHRSGTSAMAHLLAHGAGKCLLDDPEWAIEMGTLHYRSNPSARDVLVQTPIVKCPRMNETLTDVYDDLQPSLIVIMIRDPRDVWASILEKVATGRSTRMLEYRRLGIPGEGVTSFAQAYHFYLQTTIAAAEERRMRLRTVSFESFWGQRISTVEGVASALGWSFDCVRASSIVDRQLGPLDNKLEGDPRPKGPGRWMNWLTAADLDHLQEAISSHEVFTREL